MVALMRPGEVPALVEPVPVLDIAVTGIAKLERLPGGWLRAVLYVDQTGMDGTPERMIVARLVGPLNGIHDAVSQMLTALDGAMNEAADRALRGQH